MSLAQVFYASFWPEPNVLRSRFEKPVPSLKPTKLETDPATEFWTVYQKIAGEQDNDLISKCVGDLDTCLLFVSAFLSLHIPIHPNRILLC